MNYISDRFGRSRKTRCDLSLGAILGSHGGRASRAGTRETGYDRGIPMTTATLSYRRILTFWLPLASTWLMMAVEGPYLAAIIARLPNATVNLAAFGVAFAFAIIIESPVIMLMSASTALVEDRPSLEALRRFAYGLIALLTLVQLVVLLPPVFDAVARLLALPGDVARLTHGGLALLLPWPAAIGYRRFRQGLLIRHNLTRRVAYGTVIRLAAMSLTAFLAFRLTSLAGAYVGSLALSVGVVVEAFASRLMTRRVVPALLARDRPPERMDTLRLPAIINFYVPLALTSLLALSVQPMVTFFMGQSRFALESLAVLPVVHGLTFIFRAIGLSYLEVGIALIGDQREHFARIRNFAVVLAIASTAGLVTIAYTPLVVVWFQTISGLSVELTTFAVWPTRILAVFPALAVAVHTQRAVLVHARRTRPITRATVLEVAVVAAVLTVGIHGFDLIGAVAAAAAILTGRIFGTLWLVPACLDVLRARPALATADAAPVAVD